MNLFKTHLKIRTGLSLGLLALTVPALPGQVTSIVDWNDVHQRIDGFGASSAWNNNLTADQADMFFSTNNGIGMSLLRTRIVAAGTSSASDTPLSLEINNMQMAQARGALVWSAPWTPASGFKNNYNPDGGDFLGSGANATNLAYASQLANYVVSIKNKGVSLYAISIQNEPDYSATYESCLWSGSQIHDFATNLYSALAAQGVSSTRIILPESQNWASNPGLYTPTLNDANTAVAVSIIANHDYVVNNVVGDTTTPAALPTSGKALWETEVSQLGGPYDGSITNAMYWAVRIHLFMTAAEVNAFHFWWLIPQGTDNSGLTDQFGNPAKRMYVFGNFSRFVRPGYYRIGVTNFTIVTPVSAYKDTHSGTFAIVAVNNRSRAEPMTFVLTNFTTGSVTPWVTSSNLSLACQPAVSVTNLAFTYMMPAYGAVTFVGQAANTPPTLQPVPDQSINPGMTLMVTNAASDPNPPPQTLTFNLLSAPTNATLTSLTDNASAVFTWRPLVSQANTTNRITVQVGDSDSLSATNSFTVIVNPLVQPALSSPSVADGQVSLTVTGAVGPDYTLWFSTNLTSWQVLFTSNSPPTSPFTLVDTNFNNCPARYYRIQLGP